MRNNAMAMASRNRPEFFLYDCCTDCWSTLQTCTEGSPRARAHWLLVTLRTRYNTTHGRKDGTPKRMLQRRIINLTARAAGKNLPLL
jgi:hypothetical protein